MPRTIRWKLILSISIPLLVTYLGMLGWDYYRQRSAATEVMQREVLERAESTAGNLDARLTGIMQGAESAATLIESRQGLAETQLRSAVVARLRQNPWAYSTAIMMEPSGGTGVPHGFALRRGGGGPGGSGGRVIELGGPDARPSEMYTRAKSERKPFWTAPFEDPNGDGRRLVAYVVPITIDDEFRGVAAASIAVDELRQLRGPASTRSRRSRRAQAPRGAPGGSSGGGGGGVNPGEFRGRFRDRSDRPTSQPDSEEFRGRFRGGDRPTSQPDSEEFRGRFRGGDRPTIATR
jgi:hypothetical protein